MKKLDFSIKLWYNISMSTTLLLIIFNTMSIQYNLPKGLLQAVCSYESSGNISAIHKHDGDGDSIGICQIKLQTARDLGYLGSESGLLNPSTNIHFAAAYLSHQLNRYNSIEQAVIAYNFGSTKGYKHTEYSNKVMKIWRHNGKM